MISVYIVDDHKLVIDGLSLLLQDEKDIEVIGYSLNAEEALEKISPAKVDVVLLDINLPRMNGIDCCKKLLKKHPELKIIAISMHKENSLIKLMLQNGAKGYVLKNAGKEEVVAAIEAVYQNQTYLGKAVNEIVLQNVFQKKKEEKSHPFPAISRREKDVLNCILDEFTTQEIADKLCISFGTVETHRRNMLIKTGARNTAGLVKIALEYELHL
ncbi:MAG: response regulator transcription factor [Flavobacteriaceae bacterium]|nr:response regulator transcription factor [Flavobacteriaceae bacterium]